MHWLTRYGPEGASSRYRIIQYVDDLARWGHTGPLEPLTPWRGTKLQVGRGIARRVARLSSLSRYVHAGERVVIQKEPVMPPVLRPAVQRSLKSIAEHVVWDIDDAVWIGRSGAAGLAELTRSSSSHIVAGNDLLAEWAGAGGAEVSVIPTCYTPSIPPEDPRSFDLSRGPRIVWIGSPSSARLLEPFVDPIAELLRRVPNCTLEMVGGAPAGLRRNPRVRVREWSTAIEHEVLDSSDFGLALQLRDTYADHKCGFKLIQYLAHGVTPIVSDGPVHRSLLKGYGYTVLSPRDLPGLADVLTTDRSATSRRELIELWRMHYSREVGLAAWSRLLQRT